MSKKPLLPPPFPSARVPAAHVRAAVAGTAQAKMPERPSAIPSRPAPPKPVSVPSRAVHPVAQPKAPVAVRPVAPHVQSTLERSIQARTAAAAPAQAKPGPQPHGRPLAAHVRAANAAIQRSVPPGKPPAPRPSAPPPPVRRLQPVQHAPHGGGTIQRMIVVADPDGGDYAIVKVASQLMRYEWSQGHNKRLRTLGPETDFSKIKKGESLFIVGHGARETGEIKGVESKQLLKYLNDKKKGIPSHTEKIVILTCFSGEDIGEEESSSLADKVAAGLNQKGIKVYGAKGFAYGSPQTKETGFNSVLPREYIAFYESKDAGVIAGALAEIRPSKDITLAIPTVGNKKIKQGERIGDKVIKEHLRKWAEHFKDERDRIEKRMKEIVQGLGQGFVALAARGVMEDEEFQGLVQEQYELFGQFLFAPQDQAYTMATS